LHRERSKAQFQLKERLQRARVAHPTNSDTVDLTMFDEDDAGEEEEFVVEGGSAQLVEASQAKEGKLCAQFGRKRTHNEQIIVAPCGIIIVHKTFYGAKAVTSVIVSIQHISLEHCCQCSFSHRRW
jgi:hypothetical protein